MEGRSAVVFQQHLQLSEHLNQTRMAFIFTAFAQTLPTLLQTEDEWQ